MRKRKRSGADGKSAHLLDTSTLLWALGDSTRILGRLTVIAGTGVFDGAQGTGRVRARRGGVIGSTQLTSIRLQLR